jgi:membrane fusion protein (multidrug efflux system)
MQQETIAEAPPVPSPANDTHKPAIAPERAKKLYLILGGVVVLIILVWGVFAFMTSGKESTDDAQIAADVVPVAPRVPGQIVAVHVRENQQVHKGDLIAELDPSDLQVKAAQASGDVETARAQAAAADARAQIVAAQARGGLTSAQAGVTSSHESVDAAGNAIAEARAGVARAEANAEKTRLDFKRAEELGGKGDIPRAQVDAARAARDGAEAELQQARARVRSSEDAKQRAEAGVQQAQGQLNISSVVPAQIAAAQAEARLAHAKVKTMAAAFNASQLNLGYTRIYAPADGYAARLSVHPGQLVTAGQTICQLVPPHTYVVANFKETQVRAMKPGQRATIAVDALGGKELEGKVESISGGTGSTFSMLPADNASGNFVKVVQRIPVRIAWDGPPSVQAPVGSSADVTVYTK